MDKSAIQAQKLLAKDERFISGRRSCKGCGKALAARIASKAIPTSDLLSESLFSNGTRLTSSFSFHSYTHDALSIEPTIAELLTYIDQINQSTGEISSTHESVTKALIGIDRKVFMSDFLALQQIIKNHKNALYLCFDNEPYMDALLNRASPSPFVLNTVGAPVSDHDIIRTIGEKQIPQAFSDADFSYIATACPSVPLDLVEKIKKGIACSGNAFILALTPCPTGWIFAPEHTIKVGIKAVQTGYFPLYEIQDGNMRITKKPEKLEPVQEYLMMQKRFTMFPPDLVPVFQRAVTSFYNELLEKEK